MANPNQALKSPGHRGAPNATSGGSWSGFLGVMISVFTLAFLAAVVVYAVRRDRGYPQASPEEVLRSAVTMVKNGEAEKIASLIYAPSPEMRAVLNRFGDLLGSLQDLGGAVAKRFPADIARIRDEALKQATSAGGASAMAAIQANSRNPRALLGATPGSGGGGGAEGGNASQPNPQRGIEDFAMTIFADPFGWIDANADRLTAVPINDDQAAVLLDGKPVPPIGLLMRYAENKWQIELPLNLPGMSRFLPQTRHEYSILGSLLRVLAAAIVELADDVRAGKVRHTSELAEKAGEKAFGPAAMVFIVYGKEMDVRNRRDRVMNDYRKRQTLWLDTRAGMKTAVTPVVWDKFIEAVDRLAVEEMDKLVRVDSLRPSREAPKAVPAFAEMNDAVFEATIEGWLLSWGGTEAKFRFSDKADGKQMERVVKAVTEAAKKPRR